MAKRVLFGITILACTLAAGCGMRLPRIQRMPVPPADVARANALAREGDLLIARGQSYAALLKYLDAAKLNPYNEVVHNKLAIAYTKLNYYDRALDAIYRSIALNQKYSYGYNTLGTIQLVQRRPAPAIKNFQRAIRFSPQVAFFYVNLANAHLQRNDMQKAMSALRQALDLDPEVMTRQGGIGVQSASVQFDGATQNYFLARLYAERGDDKQALELLRKALEDGFGDFDRLKNDKEFERLRATKEFVQLLAEFDVHQ
ncbi:MAG: tetratricopeptide repeat protein [Acidobacteria bacterium]|nr:tetratricopeptide repeat protein [Acidobacteriota bacterium]